MNRCLLAALSAAILAGCAQQPSQHVYNYDEVGKSTTVSFGTVLSSRIVDITGKNTGAGGLVGAGVGAGAGSYIGNDSGNVWATLGGALAGAIIGAAAEQAASNRNGIEYTVTLENGVTMTVVQEIAKGEAAIAQGARVMVQNTGGYQRVLPAAALPTAIAKPEGIKVIDGATGAAP